jgi:hypothetical protein
MLSICRSDELISSMWLATKCSNKANKVNHCGPGRPGALETTTGVCFFWGKKRKKEEECLCWCNVKEEYIAKSAEEKDKKKMWRSLVGEAADAVCALWRRFRRLPLGVRVSFPVLLGALYVVVVWAAAQVLRHRPAIAVPTVDEIVRREGTFALTAEMDERLGAQRDRDHRIVAEFDATRTAGMDEMRLPAERLREFLAQSEPPRRRASGGEGVHPLQEVASAGGTAEGVGSSPPPCSCGGEPRGAQNCVFCNASPFPPYVSPVRQPSRLPALGGALPPRSQDRGSDASDGSSLQLRVSRLFCVGGLERELFNWGRPPPRLRERAWRRSTCIFRDLIWLPAPDNRWLFIYDPRRAPAWDFPGDRVHNASVFPQRRPPDLHWLLAHDLEFVEVQIPRQGGDVGVVSREALQRYQALSRLTRGSETAWYILATHKWGAARVCTKTAGNFGHFLADLVWPTFSMMRQARAASIDNVILYVGGERGNPSAECARGAPFLSKGLAPLSRKPLQRLAELGQPVQLPMLVAGDALRHFDTTPLNDPSTAVAYRNHIYTTLGITPAPPGSGSLAPGPLILVRIKQHRHRMLNELQVVRFLRQRYTAAQVYSYSAAELVGDEEVRLMSQTTVLITPAGGGSFGVSYLPEFAAGIFLDVCWPCRERANSSELGIPQYDPLNGKEICCAKLESYLWTDQPFVDMYYTHRDPSSLYFDANKPYWYPYLDYSYVVDTNQLGQLVDEALDRTGFSHLVEDRFA